MNHSDLTQYTHGQLSEYTHGQLSGELLNLNLVTNRTFTDVQRWLELRNKGWYGMTDVERQEWLGEIETTPSAARGMYTHNDLNRVESAVVAILAKFQEAGYNPPVLVAKTDWTYTDMFSEDDMRRYLLNVDTLREYMVVYRSTPKTPKIEKNLDYKLANDIEKILEDVYRIATNIMNSWYYSGEIISGEV